MRIGDILKEQKEMQLKGNLYHYTQIIMAYNSNRIEGSCLTEDETRYIYETNTIGLLDEKKTVNVDDIIETINHFRAFDYMVDNYDKELTADMIKQFHYYLKRNTSDEKKSWFKVGDYKLVENIVGDITTVAPKDVEQAMDSLLNSYKQIKPEVTDIIEFHYNFEKIHPFQDGNGRVGRLIMFKECLKNDITPFVIDAEHDWYYKRGLKEFSKQKGYLVDTCLSAQDKYAAVVNNLASFFKVDDGENKKLNFPKKKKDKGYDIGM